MAEPTTRRLMWCTTHGEPAWRYGDGSETCWHDSIVEASNSHTLTELPSAQADRLSELEAEVAAERALADELAAALVRPMMPYRHKVALLAKWREARK